MYRSLSKASEAIKERAREVLGAILGRPFRFDWVINGELAWASKIHSSREVRGIWKRGIRAVLTLTEDSMLAGAVEEQGMTFMQCPLPDHAAPTLDQIERCVNFIDSNLSNQKSVVVSCVVGKGRSGAAIAAYLMQRYGYAPSHAVALLRKIRSKSIEPNQELALLKYHQTLSYGERSETL